MTGFITTLTLVSNIGFVLFLLIFVLDKRARSFIYNLVLKFPLELIFLTTFGGLVFSLWYSNVSGFPPCELCWIQRMLMYPQVLLSFMAMRKKDLNMVSYLLPLTLLGLAVSFYHSLTNWGIGTGLLACTQGSGECAKVYVMEYGYITIPFMAFSSFVYLLTISLIYYRAKNVGKN